MPVVIFILMYITGVMLSFANQSNLKGFQLNICFRIFLFLKLGKRLIFINALLFQCLNLILFALVIVLYFILNENDIVTVYNIYKWTALIMFVSVMAVSIIDVALVEKSGKGYNNESN
ncbi:MAG: hypothetical protein KAH14_00400 [Clostridiales bacterium]|nr:hypothetical protein [Clostridiales bacterium]